MTLAANDDAVRDAPNKSVTVSATSFGAGGVANPADATLTITDDDDAPRVTLAVADSSISESGGVTTVSATLSHPSSAATTVTVTAVADFYTVGEDAVIVIAAGATANASDTVTITAVNDDVDNVGDRSVTVTATAANDQGIGAVTGDGSDADRRRCGADGDAEAVCGFDLGERRGGDGDGDVELAQVERGGHLDSFGVGRWPHADGRGADHRGGIDGERASGDDHGGHPRGDERTRPTRRTSR